VESPSHPRDVRWRAPATLAGVVYETELADRIRFLIGTGPDIAEKRMFGGLAFMVGGNMAISASGQGGASPEPSPTPGASVRHLRASGPSVE
jgi:hypothetical protein